MRDGHAQEEGGVGEGDGQDVDGEPHVVAQDGDQRVDGAVQDGHVVGQDQGDDGHRGGAGGEVPHAVDRLEDEGEQHRPPGDPDDRLVHVGHGRAPRDHRADHHAVGVEEEGRRAQAEAGPPQHGPAQAEAREEAQEPEQVEEPGQAEGLERVVVHLPAQVARGRIHALGGHGGQAPRQGRRRGREVLTIAVLGEAQERVAQGAQGHDGRGIALVEVAQGEPGAAGVGRVGHHAHAREGEDAIEHAERVLQRRDLALDGVELGLAVLARLGLDLLPGRLQARMRGELRVRVERAQVLVRGQVRGLAQARVGHPDHGLGAPAVGVGHHGQHPLHGVEPLHALETEGPGSRHPARGLARVGVERLHPPAVLDGERAQGLEVVRPRQERPGQDQHEEGQDETAQLHDGSPARDARGGPGRPAAGRDGA